MDYYRGRKIDKKFKEEVAKNSAIRETVSSFV